MAQAARDFGLSWPVVHAAFLDHATTVLPEEPGPVVALGIDETRRGTPRFARCADTDIPELHRLARTIQAWWPQIETFILTGITNAASEGVNRLIKLEARNAFGFRNPVNQRLRSRCASVRASWRRAKPG